MRVHERLQRDLGRCLGACPGLKRAVASMLSFFTAQSHVDGLGTEHDKKIPNYVCQQGFTLLMI